MAESFARALAPLGTEVFSAGSKPAKSLNPAAIAVMRERGIDIRAQVPKSFSVLPEGVFDIMVTMGCGDACPAHRAKRTIPWEIEDPKGKPIEAVRRIRDQIEREVRALLAAG